MSVTGSAESIPSASLGLAVGVFLSSSERLSPVFYAEAERLGRALARAGCSIVYGGASLGAMGRLADAALLEGGRVVGVIPDYDFALDIDHRGLAEMHRVSSLHERKAKMDQLSQAFVVFPGGIGTLDELTEVMALTQVGQNKKPVMLYNFLNFWDPFLELLQLLQQQGMISQPIEQIIQVHQDLDLVVDSLRGKL